MNRYQTVVLQDSFDLRPTLTAGGITGSIIGNDQIFCGNVASTYYIVTPMKDSTHPLSSLRFSRFAYGTETVLVRYREPHICTSSW